MRHRIGYAISILAVVAAVAVAPIQAEEKTDDRSAEITLDTLKQLEQQVEQVVARVLPATVCVRSANGPGSGSGVIVTEDGLVLTAAHVTRAAGKELVVVFPDGREVKAEPLGANRGRDAAMVRIVESGKYPHADVGKSAALKTNDWCIALGHAAGFDPRRTPPVRWGRVLNNRAFLSTDCTLISGDSGGPLFDLSGKVIGIHSNIGMQLWQNNHVPIDAFHESWDRLLAGETWGRLPGGTADPNRPVLGVQLDPTSDQKGGVVLSVAPRSPARKAGIQTGDVIRQVDGSTVQSARQTINRLARHSVGDTVKLQVARGETLREVEVKLVRTADLAGPGPRRLGSEQPGSQQPGSGEAPKTKDPGAPDGKTGTKTPADGPGKRPAERPAQSGADEKPTDSQSDGSSKSRPAKDKNDASDAGSDKTMPKKPPLNLQELMRRARRNGGRLRLTPQQAQQLRQQFGNRLRIGPGNASMPDDNGWVESVFDAYRPVVADVHHSVLPVFVDNKQVALATVMSSDGKLVTKASTVKNKSFEVELPDKQRVTGKITKSLDDYDLCVVEIDAKGLQAVTLSDKKSNLKLGEFVAAVGTGKRPEAIGVVSVLTRNLDVSRQGFLGVRMEQTDDGIRIGDVQPGSPADKAGLQRGDLLLELGGEQPKSVSAFARAIARHAPGQQVKVKLRRGDKELDRQVVLGDRSSVTAMPGQLRAMNRLGGELSKRRTGFKQALQHDCPIDPEDCGGPLVDLNGTVIGINIARAGRIKSYAIPVDIVAEL